MKNGLGTNILGATNSVKMCAFRYFKSRTLRVEIMVQRTEDGTEFSSRTESSFHIHVIFIWREGEDIPTFKYFAYKQHQMLLQTKDTYVHVWCRVLNLSLGAFFSF